jgi:hypothetical protein
VKKPVSKFRLSNANMQRYHVDNGAGLQGYVMNRRMKPKVLKRIAKGGMDMVGGLCKFANPVDPSISHDPQSRRMHAVLARRSLELESAWSLKAPGLNP